MLGRAPLVGSGFSGGEGLGWTACAAARRRWRSDPSAPPRVIVGSACRDCGKQFNERSGTLLNHTQYPSDVIALVVLWRLRYRLPLRDLSEMFLQRGIVFSYGWAAKQTSGR